MLQDSVKSAQIPQILNLLNTKYVVGGTLEQPQVQINPNADMEMLGWFLILNL